MYLFSFKDIYYSPGIYLNLKHDSYLVFCNSKMHSLFYVNSLCQFPTACSLIGYIWHSCDILQILTIEEEIPFQTVYADEYHPSWLLKPVYFWVFTVLLLSMFYNLWHKTTTNRVKFTYLKLVEIGDIALDEVVNDLPSTASVSRTHTV